MPFIGSLSIVFVGNERESRQNGAYFFHIVDVFKIFSLINYIHEEIWIICVCVCHMMVAFNGDLCDRGFVSTNLKLLGKWVS